MKAIIVVSGTPWEQGVQQGEMLRDLIEKNIRLTKAKLAAEKVDTAFYEDFISRNASYLEENHPEQIEEIKGMAMGSGLPYADMLSLNIPAYFLTKYFDQECSMLLVRSPASADGCSYLIKNRDMSTYLEQIVLKRQSKGGSIIEVSGAGTVTYPASGINSHGLGIATTGFWSQKLKPNLDGIGLSHIFVNIRILLEDCKTVPEVIERLKTYPRMNGLNILAADLSDAAIIETTADNLYIQKDDGSGLLWRTNHYINPDIARYNPDPGEYSSTFKRYERIGQMLSQRLQKGKMRFQDIWRIMSDHENGVNSICRHPSEGYPAWTASTSMVVLEDQEAWTTLNNPCMNLRFAKIDGNG